MAEGTTVTRDELAARSQQLGFNPKVPTYPTATLRWIDVSSHDTVAIMFDFTGDPAFGRDARVQVEESKASMTPDEFFSVKRPGTYSTTTTDDTTVLVLAGSGTSDALFIRDGVLYDITGPTLPPDEAQALATALVTEVAA